MVNDHVCRAVADSGMKQKFIAEKIGMSEPTFSAMLAGKRKIDADEFFKICDVLKMRPEVLYKEQENLRGSCVYC